MNTFLSKLKIHSIKPVKGFSSANRLNPHRHWIILLRVFCGIFLLLIVFSIYLLYQIRDDQLFHTSDTSVTSPNPIRDDLLKKVNSSLDQKASTLQTLKDKPMEYTDPGM